MECPKTPDEIGELMLQAVASMHQWPSQRPEDIVEEATGYPTHIIASAILETVGEEVVICEEKDHISIAEVLSLPSHFSSNARLITAEDGLDK